MSAASAPPPGGAESPPRSDTASEAVFEAVRVARDASVTVPFDLNFRGKLWSPEQAGAVYRRILPRRGRFRGRLPRRPPVGPRCGHPPDHRRDGGRIRLPGSGGDWECVPRRALAVGELHRRRAMDRARDGCRLERFRRLQERFHDLEHVECERGVGPGTIELPIA